ncbi:MAG: hypothetical protein M1819_002756 [Sarea resinae]|nr:MAG: hypothetical protein M1819_002756 [Sarea resinae]
MTFTHDKHITGLTEIPPSSKVRSAGPRAPKTSHGYSQSAAMATHHDGPSTTTLVEPPARSIAASDEYDPKSAFYCHPTTRYSFEQQKSESKTTLAMYNEDLERGPSAFRSTDRLAEHSVWPTMHALKSKASLEKKKRGCAPLRRLDFKQKLAVKILIALVIVGGAVAIGFGVSKAVGNGNIKGEQ